VSGTTVVLADDHAVVRQGLRALLKAEPGFEVIGETDDGLEALSVVERLRPAVLILDVMMPGLNGLDVARQIARRFPATRVVVLSMYGDQAHILEALRNGAAAYVLKGSDATEIVRAIREVSAGRRYLSPSLSEHALADYVEKAKVAPVDSYETLTTREREVLHLAAEGYTNVQIGERLSVSPRTVEVHRAHLMHKLGLSNQTDLVRYALRRGILPLEE
jgi:DNA-binding NarL/FixJ family response regulator